jgi:secretion-regulating guanine nucleotide exchange factor
VFSWGQGKFGQLGSGRQQDRFKPEEVHFKSSTRIIKVNAGNEHAAFLDVTGRLFMCGSNEKGQLGLGNIDTAGSFILEPLQIPSFSDCAKQVACGYYHTLVLSLSGLVYAAGLNNEG